MAEVNDLLTVEQHPLPLMFMHRRAQTCTGIWTSCRTLNDSHVALSIIVPSLVVAELMFVSPALTVARSCRLLCSLVCSGET